MRAKSKLDVRRILVPRLQITKFSIHQTSKIAGLVYFCLTLVIVPLCFVFVFSDFTGPTKWFLLLAPFGYGFVAYVFTAFACFIYNVLVKKVGGIEFSTSDTDARANYEYRNA